jgi:ribosomal protein S18 acetylase RimI-like enzyme
MSSQSPVPADITLRPVETDDYDFLVEIYASTRADELALVPWTAEQCAAFVRSQFAAQQEHYAKTYPGARHDVILFNGRPVGHLHVARLDHEMRIVDLTLLPTERNLGIGSYLIQQLVDESKRAGKLTRIYVEDFNPSLHLFERFGFSRREQQGIHVLMEKTP